jgi:FdhD protein
MTREMGTIEETPWWLEVNGRRVTGGTMKPDHARALGAGRLLTDGWIQSAIEIMNLEVGLDPVGCILVQARIPPERARDAQVEAEHRMHHGCGLLHFVACEPALVRRMRTSALPSLDVFPDMFRTLFEAAENASRVGGLHAAALVDGVTLLAPREDVSRHNAVDKVIGEALLAERDLSTLGLLVTARVSGEMAQKAARAGVAWVASRSIPTTLAVTIARVAGLPVIARAPAPDAAVMGGIGTMENEH